MRTGYHICWPDPARNNKRKFSAARLAGCWDIAVTLTFSMTEFKGSIAIVGAGQDGSDLVRLLLHERDVNIVCIVDPDPNAAGIALAKKHGIPVCTDQETLFRHTPDIIFNTTANAEAYADLARAKAPETELIDTASVRFFLGMMKKHYVQQAELTETAEDAKTYLENVLDNVADSVITTDTGGRIVEFNPGATRIFGYMRDEMVGKHIETLWINPEQRREILGLMERDGFISNYETKLQTKDGRILDTIVTLSYITNDTGERIGTVGITKDITEKKRLQREIEIKNAELRELNERLEEKVVERTQELRRANAELERSNKIKSQFIATMSHELRTPLNSILGFSELLGEDRGGTLNEKQKRYISNIYNSGSHLLQLINNILDLAKIESGKMDLNPERFFVPQAIDEVTSVIRPLFDKKHLTFNITIARDVTHISADRIKFKQVLYNLLSNAVKFTPDRGEIGLHARMVEDDDYGRTSPSHSPAKNHLQLSITDSGIGIKPEDQDRIFSEFEQVDNSYARRYEGTGLGLALTRRIVELHSGVISVQSEEEKGSTFTVTLPPREETAVSLPCVCPPAADEQVDHFAERSGAAPMIVVVEDDSATRELLTLYLAEGGYQVATVRNGDDAVATIRELQPFAVILDVMLPGKDGWQILQELKSDTELKEIPVIMATMVDNQELGFALGATDYLMKPIDRSGLVKKLEQITNAHKRHRKPVTILCVDDHADVLELLSTILESGGYSVLTADSGREGMEKAVVYRPDLIILDLMMPDMDGFEVAQSLKANVATADIPICILTAKDITVEERMELAGKIESVMQKSFFSKEDLLLHIRDLEIIYPSRAGLIDRMSGLFDRCYFHIRLAQEVNRAGRYRKSFSIVTIDLDHFSRYHDQFGMKQCNVCIRRVADFLKKTLRGSDTIARFGFDEFAVILTDTTQDSAVMVAQRFLAFIESYPFFGIEQLPGGKLSATLSVVTYPHDAKAPEEIMAISHHLLKTGKEHGGGRVVTNE